MESGGLSPLIDGGFGDIGQRFVRRLFFLESVLQERDGVLKTKLLRPGDQRAIPGYFIVLDGLGRGEQSGIKGG